ncbi:class I SAM-dependent methyltransferase [candidate division WOR-3 bacterium]|nr:class I SAM-dependent methyltransferase [candidate division WOR-3 bacterium]
MKKWSEYDYRYAILHLKDYDNWEFREIITILSPKKGERILDVGCGTGEFCYFLKKKYEVVPEGIDVNEKALKIASSNYPDISFKNVKLKDMDKDIYDAVTMIEVVEHLPKPLNTLRSIKRLLKKEGRIVVSTPNRWAFLHKIKSAITGYDYLYDPLHIQLFNHKSLLSLFLKAGLNVDKVYTKPLGIPFIRHINESLYFNIKSGRFGVHIFLKAHRRT